MSAQTNIATEKRTAQPMHNIPLAEPNISGNEGKYLQECIATGFVSSVGEFVTRFEQMVAEAAGAPSAVAACSGTAALRLALHSVGVKHNDLVILPSFTFIASANAIAHCGADPWLLDIDDSWTLDADLLKHVLHTQTKREQGVLLHRESNRRVAAIMPVYTLGMPADMDAIKSIAQEFNLPVIADGAAALGARYKNRNLGSLADLTVFSFNGNKTVTAGGGGMMVGPDVDLLQRVRHLSTQARVGAEYHHDEVGFNYRITNLQAAVGCAQMERLNEFVAAKRRIQARYNEAFGESNLIGHFPERQDRQSACWFSGITLAHDAFPEISTVCATLREQGVGTRTFWKPIHLQPPYANAPRTALQKTESIWKRILTLPCSTQLTEKQQEQVIRTVIRVLNIE